MPSKQKLGEKSFPVKNSAPDAQEVVEGKLFIPNIFGNFALHHFTADETDTHSEVRLDLSVEPPILHLKNALVTITYGHTNLHGEFVPLSNALADRTNRATGTYSGGGSELWLMKAD